ncbi:site-specific integrase [Sphingomonas sp. RT2P30]|uniref:site-specific integrase n=1 Tax=Parasphingomonas halimpatiens TaxID=3096162 RepID=UPI002FCAD221
MCDYLSQRGSTYYFRRVIPAALQGFIGQIGWTYSLRTKDYPTAKRMAQIEGVRTSRILEDAEDALRASLPDANLPFQRPALTPAQQEEFDSRADQIREAEARRLARKPERDIFRRRMDWGSGELTRTEQVARDILRQRDSTISELEARLSILDGNAVAGLTRTLANVVAPNGQSAMLDGVIVDLWAAERKVDPKGIDTHRAVARWFYERVGTKPVHKIARKDVIAFKAKLVSEGQSPANIRVKLSRLGTLLSWAMDNDYASDNPAKGITMLDPDAARNKRREFDLASLNAVFASPVYSEGARPTMGRGEAAYWLPLLAIFTGARLEELGQLRPSDVDKVAYPDADGQELAAWVIVIKEDRNEGLRIKNAASERCVPVHATLERLGFLRFVAAAKSAGQERLFPALKANVYGRVTAKWGEWFSLYKRAECGITDKRMVFHSFRHTFKHYARHVGIVEGVQRQLMGHSSSDSADDYGSGHTLHQLVEGMALYRVPGFVLPAPPPTLR